MARHLAAVGQRHDAVRVLAPEPRDALADQHLGPEAAGLRHSPLREIRPCDAARKAQVVLDHRAGSGLAARRVLLDQQGVQPLGRRVHGVREPRRPAADDDDVVEGKGRRGMEAGLRRQLGVARGDHAAPVREQHDRQARRLPCDRREQLAALRVLLDVDPLVGHLVAGQELASREALRGPARAEDADALEGRAGARRPPLEQIVEHRVEALLRRIPGLHQVVMEPAVVDRGDRRLGVGVGREQHAHRIGIELARLAQKLRAGHLRHALVHEQQRHGAGAALELP